jgi:nucleotide sugar dehydrogenase
MNNIKIIDMQNNELEKYLKTGQLHVCVIGIGRIGLPTALSFAYTGLPTVGLDINKKLVDSINSGNYPLKDEPGFEEMFKKVISNKKFSATTDINEAITNSDIIVLSLPTPMDANFVPDYSAILSVGQNLNKLLKKGSLIIVESTVEPGFIENEFIKTLEDSNGSKIGVHFSVSACPETANPGEILSDFKKLPRLVGSINEKTTDQVSMIYHFVFGVEIIKMPDCKTANAAKLTSNVFRDVNIAFVNELAILFEKMGIDILKVLEACDKKYNFQTHYPGAGVGGPCLPVNSYQFLNSARKTMGELKIIETARKINEQMPYHTVELLADGLKEIGKSFNNSTIAILGISYKPNVRDIQLTPVEQIVKRLDEMGSKIKIYDPYYKSTAVFSHKTEASLFDAIENADAVILATAHDELKEIDPTLFVKKMKKPLIIDARGIMDSKSAKKAGVMLKGIGRGSD